MATHKNGSIATGSEGSMFYEENYAHTNVIDARTGFDTCIARPIAELTGQSVREVAEFMCSNHIDSTEINLSTS